MRQEASRWSRPEPRGHTQRLVSMRTRRLATLAGALPAALLAACGSSSNGMPAPESTAPSPVSSASSTPSTPPMSGLVSCLQPGYDYRSSRSTAPAPERLAADRPCEQGLLATVKPDVQPVISGADAYARCTSCHNNDAMTEELADYSAPTPASIPAECVPRPGATMPATCGASSSPWYQHSFVWFFVWQAPCAPAGGPAPRPAGRRPLRYLADPSPVCGSRT